MQERMREDPVSEPFDPRKGWLPYAASAAACWAAIASAWPLLFDFFSWFAPAMMAGVAAGIPVSLFLRSRRFHQYRVNLVVFGIAGVLGAVLATALAEPLAAARSPVTGFIFTSARQPSALFLHLFAWVAMFHAFTLVTEGELLLTILPGMSILVIAAVIVGGWQTGVWIVVFTAAAAVLFANDAVHGLISRIARSRLPEEPARRAQAALRAAVGFGMALPLALGLAWLSPRIDPLRIRFLEYQTWTDARLGPQFYRLITALRPAQVQLLPDVTLGEQAASGTREVFRVRAPFPALYRGAVYHRYEQNRWSLDRGSREDVEASPEGYRFQVRDPGRAAGIDSVAMEQVVRAGTPLTGVLFAAYEPELLVGSVRRVRCYAGATLATSSRLDPGETYSVVSQRKEPVAEADRVEAFLSEEQRARYLQLPESIPQDGRVQGLAREITAGLTDPFDKARAISSYLESNYAYISRIEAPPAGVERVEHFLFASEGAYCDYFASALAVMCRAAGVPARMATGYRTDDVPEADNWYLARERNAHAWVDVFVDGYGWTELDPSPIGEERTPVQRAGETLGRAGDAVKRAATWPFRRLARVPGVWWKLPLALALLLALARGVYEVLREKPLRPPEGAAGAEAVAAYLVAAYRQMRRWLAKWGYPKPPGQTAGEYAVEVTRRGGVAAASVEAIVDAYTAARYAGAATAEHAQQAAGALADLLAARRALRRAAPRPDSAAEQAAGGE